LGALFVGIREDPRKKTAMTSTPAITPRNLHFDFEESLPADWHSGEVGITLFYDALSLTFPEGERFFIASVRNFARQIKSSKLRQDVSAFAAQESIHSREHAAYNALLKARGIPVEKFEKLIRIGVELAQRYIPWKAQLAATCAYEHYTALFAESLLGDERVLAGAHPFYRDLWRWHAMEEEEHKAVAFDVYTEVATDRLAYIRRAIAMLIVTLDFWITNSGLMIWLMARRGELFNLRAWARASWYLWISPGVWRRVMAGVFAYLAPDFHPWKREVRPEVLAWRTYYRETVRRAPQSQPLFDSSVA
jgi:predicted metal-dependent hydrolase